MFDTIVVGLDGSDHSEKALKFAAELARQENARLVVAHVEEDVVGKGGGPIHATEDEIQAEIARRAEELSAADLETNVEMTSVMLGGPAPAIAKIADQEGADLIVVGSRGLTAISGMLLGSVAQRLPHFADVPVLVIPSATAVREQGSPSASARSAA